MRGYGLLKKVVTSLKVYLCIETADAAPADVAAYIRSLGGRGLRVARAEIVFGAYDIVARLESKSIDRLDEVVHEHIANHPGVQKVVTCLVTPSPEEITLSAEPVASGGALHPFA